MASTPVAAESVAKPQPRKTLPKPAQPDSPSVASKQRIATTTPETRPDPVIEMADGERSKRNISTVAIAAYSAAGPVVRRTLSTLTRKRSSTVTVKPPLADDFFAAPMAPPESVPASSSSPGSRIACAFCGEQILAIAKKCKHCGETLDIALRAAEENRRQVELLAGHQNAGPAYSAPVNVHVNNVVSNTTVIGRDKRRGFSLIAGLLSLFVPGLGQLYRGRLLAAICWFVFTAIGYAFLVVPGLILHLLCVLSALLG